MPSRLRILLSVTPTRRRAWRADLTRKIQRAVRTVLRCEARNAKMPQAATVSVVICDDATIHALNRQFLRHDYPTDVLSFPLGDALPDGTTLLGEIVISVDTATRNARRYRQPLERELVRLAIHGALHLLGYDDRTPSQRRHMRRKERAYLQRLEGAAHDGA